MKLKDFIKQLQSIADKKGSDLDVVMADNLPVVNPFFADKYIVSKPVVVITDQN
jgi:hypothetical protein